jgi:hypothetical protein
MSEDPPTPTPPEIVPPGKPFIDPPGPAEPPIVPPHQPLIDPPLPGPDEPQLPPRPGQPLIT